MATPSPISLSTAAVLTAVVAGAATALVVTMNAAEEPLTSPPEVVIEFVDAAGNPVVPYAAVPEVVITDEPTPTAGTAPAAAAEPDMAVENPSYAVAPEPEYDGDEYEETSDDD